MTTDALTAQIRQNIEDDIAKRRARHQAAIARYKMSAEFAQRAGPKAAAAIVRPLALLANGDSWFDYPLLNNGPFLQQTDIVEKLLHYGPTPPKIMSVAHRGDATTDEMGLEKQLRMIREIADPGNWFTGKPDAILFSGGGNDIAGDQFCIFLDHVASGGSGLNGPRFGGAVSMIKSSYSCLFDFRDRYSPGVPIFAHCYDFPIPDGRHPICAGPWLRPSLEFCGWSVPEGTKIVKKSAEAFQRYTKEYVTGLV